eukprot:TRINITY_DN23027_c0_g1_i1.p3 TRINITY_DN23027_c0_g1~~TRINITY_DN23027_c0_g1_i1.p3  ORF type:complete len:119 (+),score=9.37 TRINITY_DN23027_c0_g1_i1:50-358(+)
MMWHGAARASDVQRLSTRDIQTEAKSDQITIVWTTTKSDPFQLGKTTGMSLPPEMLKILRSRMKELKTEGNLFPPSVTYRCIAAAVKRVDARLTPHSLRRGD